jgi:hypothetical protein
MAEDWLDLDKVLDDNDKSRYDSFEDWAADESDEYAKTFIPDDARNYPQLHFIKGLLAGTQGYVAGGCFKDILNGKKPRDLDVYFKNDIDFNEAVGLFDGKAEQGTASKSYSTKNVIAYHYHGYTLEFVDSWHTDIVDLIMRFDFNVDKFAYEPEFGNVFYQEDFFKDLVMHRLSISGYPPFPLATYNRMFKYAKYGYTPCRETKVLLASLISKLPEVKDADFSKDFYEGFD